MANRKILIIGGAKSGKNRLAMSLAEGSELPVIYIATGIVTDDEMDERIKRHRKERPSEWSCIEEPLELENTIIGIAQKSLVIIDCITFWLNNIMYTGKSDEACALELFSGLLAAMNDSPHDYIVISNEVGLGIVPEYPLARAYRDYIGIVNQIAASWADEVYQTFAGLNRRWK